MLPGKVATALAQRSSVEIDKGSDLWQAIVTILRLGPRLTMAWPEVARRRLAQGEEVWRRNYGAPSEVLRPFLGWNRRFWKPSRCAGRMR
jgi:hypothetical protein